MTNEELNNINDTENPESTENNTQDNTEHNTTNTEEQTSESNPEEETSHPLENQLKELNDKYLRLVAEFDNFRKRNAKERIELMKTASEDIIKALLEVIDDTDRAEQQFSSSDNIEDLKIGVTLIFNKLRNILHAKGLKAMNAKDQEFNPDMHEAITEIPAPTEDMKGKVIDEVIKGYTLNEKIIRHAKVVVGK